MGTRWKLVALVLVFVFVGCENKKQDPEEPEVQQAVTTETYQLVYFYIDSCARCQDVEEEVIPAIEAEFGQELEVIKYNMDTEGTQGIYDTYIDRLIGYDVEEEYGVAPLIILNNYFAKLGLSSGDSEEFVDDLHRAINGEPLGEELSNKRFLFEGGNIKE